MTCIDLLFQEDPNQAVDILHSGQARHTCGPDAGRLLLAEAEVEADRSQWHLVANLSRKAAMLASDSSSTAPTTSALMRAEVEFTATCLAARAALILGRDAEAFEAAQKSMAVARKSFTSVGEEDRRWRGLVLATAVAGGVQHAAGDIDAARESFDEVMALANHEDLRNGPAFKRDALIGDALKQCATLRLADGQPQEAASLATRAIAALTSRSKEQIGVASLAVDNAEQSLQETIADAQLVLAQSRMYKKEWEAAEGPLETALAGVEGIGGGLRAIPVLMLIARLYSRTGRVTLAEGLYRECAKLLDLKPSPVDAAIGHPPGVDPPDGVHPTLSSLLAWRYSQLLAALPKRGTESSAWQRLAKDLWDEAPVAIAATPETVFGSIEALKGRGERGTGVVVDLLTRRALPRKP